MQPRASPQSSEYHTPRSRTICGIRPEFPLTVANKCDKITSVDSLMDVSTMTFPTNLFEPLCSSDSPKDTIESGNPVLNSKAGTPENLDGIWDLYGSELYAVALWRCESIEDAEDAVQEVFVRLARRPDILSRAKNPRAYLLRMVRNAAVDILKRKPKATGLEINPDLFRLKPDFEERVDARHALEALHRLSGKQREVILMRHVIELSFREIGRICGIPTFTAASRYRLAIARLRSLLGVTT